MTPWIPKTVSGWRLAHQQADRLPIDYYARQEITDQLRARFQLGLDESVEDYLEVDVRAIVPQVRREADTLCYAYPTVAVTPDGLYRDIWGVGFRANETAAGFYIDLADSPLRNLSDFRT